MWCVSRSAAVADLGGFVVAARWLGGGGYNVVRPVVQRALVSVSHLVAGLRLAKQ